MKCENNECFEEEATVYVVEVSRKDHNLPEVIEAKKKEIKNLEDYDTFEEVADEGQEKITSCSIITKKEKHDGQKMDYKAC